MAEGGCVKARDVLWYLIFCGCVVNYMVTTNINLAIVAMVKQISKRNMDIEEYACHENTLIDPENNTVIPVLSNGTNPVQLNDTQTRYEWDEYQQGLILGGFFWLHWSSQIPGGILAQNYGTKMIYGFSNLLMCVLGFLIPFTAGLDYRIIVAIRVLQGLVGGVVWPAMHNIIAKWIPPNERSTFVTAYTGGSIGVALTFLLGGVIIDWLGWEAIFHITGVLGVLWFVAWWIYVYDTPEQHPSISETEKSYIIASLGQSVSKRKPRTPWGQIACSFIFWITVVVHWSSNMGIFTLMTQAPTYFKYIHGWSIKMTGVLSGVPHICRTLFGYFFSVFGDYLLRNNKMSRTGVRKMATCVCCIVMGIFTLGLAFSGCDYLSAIICMTVATALSGGISCGPLASFVDLSPNFAGILMGISCTLSFTAAFISPVIVSLLTYQNQTTGQWLLVYVIVSVLLIVPGIMYMCFGTSELQPWNSPEGNEREMQFLDSKPQEQQKANIENRFIQEKPTEKNSEVK